MTLAHDRAASRGPAPDRAAVQGALRAWGHEPAPPPSAAFLAGLEARLLDDAGPVEVTLRPGLAPVVPLRRKVGITAVAAAGALFVAGAAAAMGGLTRDDGMRVEPTIDRTATTAPSVGTAAPSSTAARPPVVVTIPAAAAIGTSPAGGAPTGPMAVVPSSAAMPPSATTAPADRPSSSAGQPRPSTAPATTAAPVTTAPVTTRPAEPPPPPTAPPTLPATTTTEVHTAATMTLTCAAQVVDARPAVVCEWSEPVGGAASYRLLRGVAGQSTGRVLTPAAGARRYVDDDAAATGTTYRYTAQALDAAGTVVAHSGTATVVR